MSPLDAPVVPLAEVKPLWLSLVVVAPLVGWVARRQGYRPGWLLPLSHGPASRLRWTYPKPAAPPSHRQS